MNVLGIETSCDETSAAVMQRGVLKSNIIASQFVHTLYGGVVPELASRAHLQMIVPVVDEALRVADIEKDGLDGVAVTYGPGLAGALLVGLNFAKALTYGLGVPFVGVNHMEAHIYANFIDDPKPQFPFLCLIVSGGHTQLVLVHELFQHELLGETRDDAAGEAYDKVAKMLGLGFPGGPMIDKLAATGDPTFIKFPRSYLDENTYDFSFSGIKTSVLYLLRDRKWSFAGQDHPTTPSRTSRDVPSANNRQLISDLCASFQAAVIEVLVEKTMRAAEQLGVREITIAGGVSANSELRKRMKLRTEARNYRLHIPKPAFCTDNGAMVAMLGHLRLMAGMKSDYGMNAAPNLSL